MWNSTTFFSNDVILHCVFGSDHSLKRPRDVDFLFRCKTQLRLTLLTVKEKALRNVSHTLISCAMNYMLLAGNESWKIVNIYYLNWRDLIRKFEKLTAQVIDLGLREVPFLSRLLQRSMKQLAIFLLKVHTMFLAFCSCRILQFAKFCILVTIFLRIASSVPRCYKRVITNDGWIMRMNSSSGKTRTRAGLCLFCGRTRSISHRL